MGTLTIVKIALGLWVMSAGVDYLREDAVILPWIVVPVVVGMITAFMWTRMVKMADESVGKPDESFQMAGMFMCMLLEVVAMFVALTSGLESAFLGSGAGVGMTLFATWLVATVTPFVVWFAWFLKNLPPVVMNCK